jgi:hypothetical protein
MKTKIQQNILSKFRYTKHYAIKFVSDLRQVGGFLCVLRFPPPIKTDSHNITEIYLKVALNTVILTLTRILVLFA